MYRWSMSPEEIAAPMVKDHRGPREIRIRRARDAGIGTKLNGSVPRPRQGIKDRFAWASELDRTVSPVKGRT
jgi:hypothetical protein